MPKSPLPAEENAGAAQDYAAHGTECGQNSEEGHCPGKRSCSSVLPEQEDEHKCETIDQPRGDRTGCFIAKVAQGKSADAPRHKSPPAKKQYMRCGEPH